MLVVEMGTAERTNTVDLGGKIKIITNLVMVTVVKGLKSKASIRDIIMAIMDKIILKKILDRTTTKNTEGKIMGYLTKDIIKIVYIMNDLLVKIYNIIVSKIKETVIVGTIKT